MLKHQENLVPSLKIEPYVSPVLLAESNTDNGTRGNKSNMSNTQEEQKEAYRLADEEAQKKGGQRQYGGAGDEVLPPRGEGYRRAPIRESRIKDRPFTPMSDNLSIKIELDLEVEVRSRPRIVYYCRSS